MKWRAWFGIALTATTISGFAGAAIRADSSATTPPEAIVVFREQGKPDRVCIIEKSTVQADDSIVHELRDSTSGERFRVVDSRRHKGLLGAAKARTAAQAQALNAPDATQSARRPTDLRRVPTPAEQANYVTPTESAKDAEPSFTGVYRRSKPLAVPNDVQEQIKKLKEGDTPADRENAAFTLTLSDAHASPEVLEALIVAIRSESVSSVRVTLVRCLARLAGESPSLVVVIKQMQSDSDEQVSRAAQMAMLQLAKR